MCLIYGSQSGSINDNLFCCVLTKTLQLLYVQPDGNIYPLLRDVISPGATDLTEAFNTGQNPALQELAHVIENIVFHMTDIMVSGCM